MDLRNFDRNATPTSSSGKDVKNTSMLKGEAKDSLSGTNVTKQYETTAPSCGPLGGKPKAR